MSDDITQIEIDRVHHALQDGSVQEVFGVYCRRHSGEVIWHEDYNAIHTANHFARLLSAEHDCPILDTTATGLIRRPGE